MASDAFQPPAIALIPGNLAAADGPRPAGELYSCSPDFVDAMRDAMAHGHQVIILSTRHGVLDPTAIVQPHQQAMDCQPGVIQRLWAQTVLPLLLARLTPGATVVSYLGHVYGRLIVPVLQHHGIRVEEACPCSRSRESGVGAWEFRVQGHPTLAAARSLVDAWAVVRERCGLLWSTPAPADAAGVSDLDAYQVPDHKRDSEMGEFHFCTLREWIGDAVESGDRLPVMIEGPKQCSHHHLMVVDDCPACCDELLAPGRSRA